MSSRLLGHAHGVWQGLQGAGRQSHPLLSKQTLGFFSQNLVMECDHAKAVADGVNVDFDVYEIRTAITEAGSKVDAGPFVDKRDRQTREKGWEQLDEALVYEAGRLDRASSPGTSCAR